MTIGVILHMQEKGMIFLGTLSIYCLGREEGDRVKCDWSAVLYMGGAMLWYDYDLPHIRMTSCNALQSLLERTSLQQE